MRRRAKRTMMMMMSKERRGGLVKVVFSKENGTILDQNGMK